MANRFDDIDDYIATFSPDIRDVLVEIRRNLRSAAPEMGESISYQMPTLLLDGEPLISFAAWKHHIGLYPIPVLDDALEQEVSPYRATKDTVRLPLGEPIPYDLVAQLAKALVSRRRQRNDDR